MADSSLLSVIQKSVAPRSQKFMQGIDNRGNGGWWPLIKESFAGAWQQNIEVNRDTVLAYHAVFACITLIASDISKMRVRLVKSDSDGIWNEIPFKGYEVLKKPNSFQNRIQFHENWVNSKLTRGNTYVLKERDRDKKVIAFYVLAPDRVTPLVSDTGDIFYQLATDNLTGLTEDVIVPASEIIHDRGNCLFHPLVGLSPIFACGLAAVQGLKIQNNSAKFFDNMSRPSGVLTAPGAIDDATAKRLKEHWETNFGGDNIGRVAVLGDGLHYAAMSVTAVDAQLVEQLKMSSGNVCSAFHVPPYMVGVENAPSYNNVEALNQQYYSQCLQVLIESMELCLDEGLALPDDVGVEFDLDGLLRMDTATQVKTLAEAVKGGLDTPNEARKKRNQKALPGGNTVYLQQQMFSLEALAKRDAKDDPFASGTSKTDPVTPAEPDDNKAIELLQLIEKEFSEVTHGFA